LFPESWIIIKITAMKYSSEIIKKNIVIDTKKTKQIIPDYLITMSIIHHIIQLDEYDQQVIIYEVMKKLLLSNELELVKRIDSFSKKINISIKYDLYNDTLITECFDANLINCVNFLLKEDIRNPDETDIRSIIIKLKIENKNK
jgi:hypothetical protein